MASASQTKTEDGKGGGRSGARTGEESLEVQIEQLRDDLKAIAATIAGMAENRVSQTRGNAEHEVEQLVRTGQQAVEGLQDELGQMEKRVKEAIRRRPLTSVAGAVAVGFVIALLTR